MTTATSFSIAANLTLGTNNALPNATVVTLGAAGTRGTLNLGAFTDTVTGLAFSGSGGTATTAGSPAAVTFANAAAGYLLSGGTLTLNGGASAALVTTTTGSHEIASAVALATNATLNAASNARLTISGPIGGSRGVEKLGPGVVVLAGSNTYSGTTTVSQGTLVLDGSVAGDVTITAGGMVTGRGVIAGTVAGPGSIGILTAVAFNPTAGADFVFQFSGPAPNYANAAASVNDVLRLTSPTTALTSNLTAANTVDIFLDVSSLAFGNSFQGGFFTDATGSFLPSVSGANYRFFVKGNGSGTAATYDGVNYYALDAAFLPGFTGVAVSTVTVPVAAFASGTIFGGRVTQFQIVPEPAAAALAAIGAGIAELIRKLAAWQPRSRLPA